MEEENETCREEESKMFAKIVNYFAGKIRANNLPVESHTGFPLRNKDSELSYYHSIGCHSNYSQSEELTEMSLPSINISLNYSFGKCGTKFDIEKTLRDPLIKKPLTDTLTGKVLEGDIKSAEEHLRKTLISRVPQPTLAGLDIGLYFGGLNYLNNFNYGIGLSTGLEKFDSVDYVPQPKDFKDKEEFNKNLIDWQNFFLPLIEKYGDEVKYAIMEYDEEDLEFLVLGAQKSIDVGFKICTDEELHSLWYNRYKELERQSLI